MSGWTDTPEFKGPGCKEEVQKESKMLKSASFTLQFSEVKM